MKLKRIPLIIACSALLVGSFSLAAIAGQTQPIERAKAETDVGQIEFDLVTNDSSGHALFLVATETNAIPASWDYPYNPVGSSGGIFVNGVDVLDRCVIKKVGPYDYYVELSDYNLGAGDAGTIVEVSGSWSGTDGSETYTFTIKDYYRSWNGSGWEYALADYDVVSLADCNMPDFVGTTINTEDGGNYAYSTDPYGACKQHNVFGLTNGTGSYAFQFNFETTGAMTSWLEIRIGANSAWKSGHFMRMQMTTIWNDGVIQVGEMTGNGNSEEVLNGHHVEFRSDIDSAPCLIELGVIKVLGYESKHLVYFKNNNATAWSTYWDIDATVRTTRVGMYSGCSTINVTNSIPLLPVDKISLSGVSTDTALYFNTAKDILPVINSWDLYFVPVNEDGIKLNGSSITSGHWNYFKKVGTTNNCFFLGLGDLGVTPAENDVLFIGGLFKLAVKDANNNMIFYKILLDDFFAEFNGTAWVEVNDNYKAADFAKDLLKLTLTICTGGDGDNGSALSTVWATLADNNHYGKLTDNQKLRLANAASDGTVVVPLTSTGVDEMTDADALGAAMYRYEFCVAKYNLTQFIVGRSVSSSNSGINLLNDNGNVNIVIVISVALSVVSLAIAATFIIRKRKEVR